MVTTWICLILAVNAVAAESWWENGVFYQIYPRSFFDKNGTTGSGSIAGITDKIDHLKDLGITGLWMNPIYPSPFMDGGYDISNFTDVDSRYGTLDDLKTLIKTVHDKGMKILLDLVPNHSSDQHPWFKNSLAGVPDYKDFYIWQDKMPNNWKSVMGGSAWTKHSQNGKYYYHAFLKEQPDLNYRNDKVVKAMLDVMTFWLELGVDGFRVDAVPYLVESKSVTKDEPLIDGCTDDEWRCLNHTLTASQDETFVILAKFKQHLDDYSHKNGGNERIMITEATYPPQQLSKYFSFNGNDTSTMPFNFELLSWNNNMTAQDLKNVIDNVYKFLPKGKHTNWLLGNHDQNRIAHKIGRPLVDAANMLNLLLPGTTFTYYGEEINMDDTPIKCSEIQDTSALNQGGGDCDKEEALTRDHERTPMQWSKENNAGFSKADNTWLPVNPDYTKYNVEVEKSQDKSHYKLYKDLVQLKKDMSNYTIFEANAISKWVYSFSRTNGASNDSYIVLVNLNNEVETLNFSQHYTMDHKKIEVVAVSINSDKSKGSKIEAVKQNIMMRPYEGIVIFKSKSGTSSLVSSLMLPILTVLFCLWRQ